MSLRARWDQLWGNLKNWKENASAQMIPGQLSLLAVQWWSILFRTWITTFTGSMCTLSANVYFSVNREIEKKFGWSNNNVFIRSLITGITAPTTTYFFLLMQFRISENKIPWDNNKTFFQCLFLLEFQYLESLYLLHCV